MSQADGQQCLHVVPHLQPTRYPMRSPDQCVHRQAHSYIDGCSLLHRHLSRKLQQTHERVCQNCTDTHAPTQATPKLPQLPLPNSCTNLLCFHSHPYIRHHNVNGQLHHPTVLPGTHIQPTQTHTPSTLLQASPAHCAALPATLTHSSPHPTSVLPGTHNTKTHMRSTNTCASRHTATSRPYLDNQGTYTHTQQGQPTEVCCPGAHQHSTPYLHQPTELPGS